MTLSGCGGDSSKSKYDDSSRGPRVVPVSVCLVSRDDVVFSSDKIGVVEVYRQASINFSTAGSIETFPAKEEQYIYKGEKIATLDTTQLRATVEMTKIKLNDLEKRKSKIHAFLEKGVVTELEFDTVNTEYLTSLEKLKIDEDNLEKSVVVAPFSGILLKKIAEKGSFTAPGVPVAILVDIDKVVVKLDFSDNEVATVKIGSSIELRTDAFPSKIFNGTIQRIVPSVDISSRMTRVEIIVENPERMLRPGMMVRTDIVLDKFKSAVSIPVDCLVYQGAKTSVYVVNRLTFVAVRRKIIVERLYGDKALVSEGLEAGETIVSTGQSYLSDSTQVRILE
jgi:RND family efflux transporter MFP subunit